MSNWNKSQQTMKKTSLFLLLALALVLSSCDENEGSYAGADPQDGLLLSFSATGEPVTGVSVGADGTTLLEDGDRAVVCVPAAGTSSIYIYSTGTGTFTPETAPIDISGNQAYVCYPAEYFTAPSLPGGAISMTLPETLTALSAGTYGFDNPMAGLLDGSTLSAGTASVQLKNIGSVLRVNLTGADAESGTVSSLEFTSDVNISGTSTLTWNNGVPVLSSFDGAKTVTADCGDYDVTLSATPASFSFFLPAGVQTDLNFIINSADGSDSIPFGRKSALTTGRATLYEVDKTVTFFKEIVASEQSKYYTTAQKDFMYKLTPETAGMKVMLMDSKFYALGERVLSVKYVAESGAISGVKAGDTFLESGASVTMAWASEDPIDRPAVGKSDNPGEFGIHCFPGTYAGKFIVTTNRYTYEFTKSITLAAGELTDVTLDFAFPDAQPVRKVGIMGDSISTFDGALCNPEFGTYYPARDPNVGVAGKEDIAVDSKEKTWWWRLIYENMSYAELDANNSWTGSRVIREFKTGRFNKERMAAGFVDRVHEFIDPDIILIHGGTNDSFNNSPVGEYEWDLPIGQNNVATFRGAYIELIKKLQNDYEGVQLILVIGTHLTTNYAVSVEEIARYFGLPCVSFVGETVEQCTTSHPNARGFKVMADRIYETCKDYLP